MLSMKGFGFHRRDGRSSASEESVTPGFATDLLRFFSRGGVLRVEECLSILTQSAAQLAKEPTVSWLPIPVGEDDGDCTAGGRWVVVGDLHGSLGDLLHILGVIDTPQEQGSSSGGVVGMPSATNRLIFNGDFVDRGSKSVEVLCSVLALKLAFPRYVHINRGNHEDEDLNYAYDFAADVNEMYGPGGKGSSEAGGGGGTSTTAADILWAAGDAFAVMPLCAVVPRSCCGGAVVMHGGPPRNAPTALPDGDSGSDDGDQHDQHDEHDEEPLSPLERLARLERGRHRLRSVVGHWSSTSRVQV